MWRTIQVGILTALAAALGGCGGTKFLVRVDPSGYLGQGTVADGTTLTVDIIQVGEGDRGQYSRFSTEEWFRPSGGERQNAKDNPQFHFRQYDFTKQGAPPSSEEFQTAPVKSAGTLSSGLAPSYLVVYANGFDDSEAGNKWRKEVLLSKDSWPEKRILIRLSENGIRVETLPR